MRLFTTLWPGPAFKEGLEQMVKTAGTLDPSCRLVRPDQLHVTLSFIGEVDSDERICSALQTVERRWQEEGSPVCLMPTGVGLFRRGKRGILHVRLERTEDLLWLWQIQREALLSCGCELADAAYIPHLTLARNFLCTPKEMENLSREARALPRSMCRSFSLIHSHRSDGKLIYSDVRTFFYA